GSSARRRASRTARGASQLGPRGLSASSLSSPPTAPVIPTKRGQTADLFAVDEPVATVAADIDCDIDPFDIAIVPRRDFAVGEEVHHPRRPRLRAKRAQRSSADGKAIVVQDGLGRENVTFEGGGHGAPLVRK